MKAAVSETNMMVVAIILIGLIAGVATTVVSNAMNQAQTKSDEMSNLDSSDGSNINSGNDNLNSNNYVISDKIGNINLSGGSSASNSGSSSNIIKNVNSNTITGSLNKVDNKTLNTIKNNSNKVTSGLKNGGKGISFSESNKTLAKNSYNQTSNSLKNVNLNSATSKNTKVFEENGLAVSTTTYQNVKGTGNVTVTSYYKKENGEYKLVYVTDSKTSNINKKFESLAQSEKSGKESFNSIDPKLAEAFGGKVMDQKLMKEIYDNQKAIVVILNTYDGDKIVNTGSGFFINKGVIVTTFNYVKSSLIKGQKIIVKDSDNHAFEATGVVSANEELNIAVLKLNKSTGKEAVLKSSDSMKKGSMILTIGTKSGYGLSTWSGVMIENGKTLKNLLPLSKTDEGSPLFDAMGDVIGINTALSVDNDFSVAIPSKHLINLQKRLQPMPFESIKVTSIESLKEKYYYDEIQEENEYNKIDSKIWNQYKTIGDIENTMGLKLIKSNYKDGIASLRYVNEASHHLDSMEGASSFKQKLLSMGYKQILDTSNKCIFKNNEYKVIIMKEMNYLIVLLIKE